MEDLITFERAKEMGVKKRSSFDLQRKSEDTG